MAAGTLPGVIDPRAVAMCGLVAGRNLRQQMVDLGSEPDTTESPAETALVVGGERAHLAWLVKERSIKAA